jgi:DNA polymerase-3 subunit alpha
MEADYLRYITYRGVHERYGIDIDDPALQCGAGIVDNGTDELVLRIEHELATIEKAGFPGYFLIVADILRFCREAGIPTGPGRGSICGSAVAYATRITDVEPIQFGIPFERFLHLERIAQPDIDLDICQARRQEVIDYLRLTYGNDSVAQIITFTPLNAKGVVRDVCRVLHVDELLRGIKSNETGDRLALMIPEGSGADMVKLQEYMDSDEGKVFGHELKSLNVPFEGEQINVADTCLTLEGLRRHGGVHAAGVVVADRPLVELAPLYKKNKDAEVQIQYDMRDAETVGLLKMDVLGLRTVTVIGEAEALVRRRDPSFSIKGVPLNDLRTFEMLSAGDTGAVFQLEGDGITAACVGMRPDRFEDIIALIALYRPGPMEQLGSYFRRKHGEEDVSYAHPALEKILSRTYGLMVYQEQVMGLVRELGGYTAGEADMFRKAIGKKLVPLIREKIDEFIQRAVGRGHSPKLMTELGNQIFDFGRYGFNLGHATGYGFITYWTAYLKANYPAEFYTANLNSQIGVIDKLGPLLRDAERREIQILPPDINLSGNGFTLRHSGEQADSSDGSGRAAILFGIGAIKGLGEAAVRDILEGRDSVERNAYKSQRVIRTKDDGTPYSANIRVVERVQHVPRPYASAWDFCNRLTHITITAKKALVTAGAFGADLDTRVRLLSCLERLNEAAKKGKHFDVQLDPTNAPTELDILRAEREVLGFYISSHPLAYYKDDIARYGATIDGSLDELDTQCTVAGLVVGVRTHQGKRGEMAWVTLETGIRDIPDITIFSNVWPGVKQKLDKDSVLIVKGVKQYHERFGWGIKADEVVVLDRARPDADVIHVSIPDTDVMDLVALRDMSAPNGANVQVAVEDGSGRIALIATELLLPATGVTFDNLEGRGWLTNIDPSDGDRLAWTTGGLARAKSSFGGSGADRSAIWDLPLIKRALRLFGGRVVAELHRV